MEARERPADEPARLTAQIAHVERRILDRHQRIRRHVTSCKRDVASSITSAPVLLSAGGMGFVFGMLTGGNLLRWLAAGLTLPRAGAVCSILY